MGIKGLFPFIQKLAPSAVNKFKSNQYCNQHFAIDGNMDMYKSVIALKSKDFSITDSLGKSTSHLLGMWSRVLEMRKHGIIPIYVFDGPPPLLKKEVLKIRREDRKKATEQMHDARKTGDVMSAFKYEKRIVRITVTEVNECKLLLQWMGIPFVQATAEGEATCSDLVIRRHCCAVVSEDMDTLTFGSPMLLRGLSFTDDLCVGEQIRLDVLLKELRLNMDQFIDLCILMGCDYSTTIRNVGPITAYKGLLQYGSIEGLLYSLKGKYEGTFDSFLFQQARQLFKQPNVTVVQSSTSLELQSPDESELVSYLCDEKGFSKTRILTGCETLRRALKSDIVLSKQQTTTSLTSSIANSSASQLKKKVPKETPSYPVLTTRSKTKKKSMQQPKTNTAITSPKHTTMVGKCSTPLSSSYLAKNALLPLNNRKRQAPGKNSGDPVVVVSTVDSNTSSSSVVAPPQQPSQKD
jgi:flap endonuclease-1